MVSALDDIIADPLVQGVIHGDRAAWFQLTLHIEAFVEEQVPRHWRMKKARLAGSMDDMRDVLLETLERVDRDDFRALRSYLERKLNAVPDVRVATQPAVLTFASWLAGLVDFAIRDHVRRRYGRAPSTQAQRSARELNDDDPAAPVLTKRSLQSWAVHPAVDQSGNFGSAPAGLSRVLTARTILSYAADTFGAREFQLFQRYLEQASFEELAAEYGHADADVARVEIRRLKERLRSRFRDVV